ncbi:MAG: NmrA family NAD(P)-binding protein [Microscillaceae bacterium]|jgi:uncharacterized protein YbjT (DUF2867 family)|nr:NmrA family NAD(P)-binding protein [Microscillaceae bacterium]
MKVLITGATGNVGLSVLQNLAKHKHQLDIYAGVRNIDTDFTKLQDLGVKLIKFDFENPTTFNLALQGINIFFLLRPPHLARVSKYFQPLIVAAVAARVNHIVFLSVQGVEKSPLIPHHAIEKLIIESQIAYTFLRPAYFMQNFTTTLREDLIKKQLIYLPSGQAKFTLIDVDDLGAVAANILMKPELHLNQSYDLTNQETLTFGEMAAILSQGLGKSIRFVSPNLWQFFLTKWRDKMPFALIFVMMMLHYLPRFQKTPPTSDWVKKISGIEPKTFAQFVNAQQAFLK